MKIKAYLLTLGWLAMAAMVSAQEKPFYLKSGDRVVFYGDSITDQRLYTTFTETYVVTRFPKLDVTFVHSGWGGDSVGGGGGGPIDLRLERDVLAYQPTVMTIMLGMNDAAYRAFDQIIFDRYRNGFEHIVRTVKTKAPALRITYVQPSPFDDVTRPPQFEGGYNAVLVRYAQYLKELAAREHGDLADFNAPIVSALQKANAADAEMAKKIIPDRVHPAPAGQLLMAAELLKAWHAPKIVTAVEIDASGKKVLASQGTQVSSLAFDSNVAWSQMDAALPMPVESGDAVMALALKSSDFIAALNQQTLKVTGLIAARYGLKIDGASVGEFTKQQLAEGVNLAMLPTPMAKQAMEVHKLTLQHNNVHFLRWRQIQVPMAGFKSKAAADATKSLMTALDAEELEVVKQQRAAAQPVAHKYELTGL